MNILILTIGTRGDVQPHVALAVGLRKAGHNVTLCTSPRYRNLFADRGLSFAPLSDDLVAITESVEGRAALEDMSSLISGVRTAVRLIREHGDIQRQLVRDGWKAAEAAQPDLIVYHPKMACGLHFAEKLGIPAVITPLYPIFLPTTDFPNIGLAPLPLPRVLREAYNRGTHHLVQTVVRTVSTRYFREWRAQNGLPPAPRGTGVVRTSDGDRVPMLNAWSEHVAPNPDDWPESVETTGYWFLDRPEDWTMPDELQNFLAAGDPPVYIGFGSMARQHPERTTQTVLDALRRTGLRALISRGWGGLVPEDVPDSIYLFDEAPHDALFPLCSAVVHHGGAGTTAAGLRAGRPTVICPFFGDQPFWGRRVHALGVGPEPIPQKQLTPGRLAAALATVTRNERMREKAAHLGEQIRVEDGVGRAVARLEAVVRSSPQAHPEEAL
ncbi:UDP-glucose--sterol glucosyltransferase [Longibacter salinarum]|uniref:UDP-glucose--sterol glucosyltransferase n=1 Tax=Longibacter salinarum TaxID=1850348 RepID=A0A2A8CUN2_9BACT|nr:glycosyltransferase [Longibacter salinarum]PEN11466.1 UDP-glucose--sterol glucosyltransferase [Longibacter salinarum]